MNRRLVFLPAVTLVLFALSAFLPTSGASAQEAATLRVQDDTIRLTLDEAIRVALERNLSIQLERFNQRQFELGVDQAVGQLYDLQLGASTSRSESTSTSSDTLAGADVLTSEGASFNVNARQNTPFGGQGSVSFNNSRSESNNSFSFINPRYNSSLNLSYSQPLLNGLGRLVTEQNILVARIREEANRETYEEQLTQVLQQTDNAYWDLVAARKQLEVAEESLALAEELHRRNEIQVEVGTLPPLELVRSRANIASRNEEIIQARASVEDAADRLRLLLDTDQGDLWGLQIVPETEPLADEVELDLDTALGIAMKNRPEVRRQQLTLEQLEIDQAVAKNQLLPSLDLSVNYGLSGVGGDLRQVDPVTGERSFEDGGIDDAWEQILDRDNDGWSVGLNFNYPLQNRAAKANLASAGIELEKGHLEMRRLEQQILTDVRIAVRGVETAKEQIESAKISRSTQEENLRAEEKRYENGMSTSFEITQVQEDLTLARNREVNAIVNYRRAIVTYQQAVGELLESFGIRVMTPADEEAAAAAEE